MLDEQLSDIAGAISSQIPGDHITSTARVPSPNGVHYPTPPESDGIAGHPPTDVAPTLELRGGADPGQMAQQDATLNVRDYYPASAYGPHGRPGYSLQAAHETTAMAASGLFSSVDSGTASSQSQSPEKESVQANDTERQIKSAKSARREPAPFFSQPPIPVYHNQPQSVASYYPGDCILSLRILRHS
jgi:hypothetical protein